MTDQPKTATIPMDLLEKYVALQRAVDDAMHPREAAGAVAYDYPYPHSRMNIAAASLAINELTNNEQANK